MMKRWSDQLRPSRRFSFVPCVLAMSLCLPGCSDLGVGLRVGNDVTAQRAANVLLAERIAGLSRLTRGNAAEQAAIVAERRSLFVGAPSPSTALHYALVLGRPSHAAYDATEARALLRMALSAPEGLDPAERALGEAMAAEIDLRLRLEQDNQRLADETRALRDAASSSRTSANRRLQAELEENNRLRKALDEARAKLRAVAALEKAAAMGRSNTESRRP